MIIPTIVSFYTPTWEYPKHATRLRQECEKLNLPHHIEERPAADSWIDNTRIKSAFLCETMELLDRPLLWIDVDGSILKAPKLLYSTTVDFAGRPHGTIADRAWHVAVMFFNNTSGGKQLLREWNLRCMSNRHSDELAFNEVWRVSGDNYTSDKLPKEYLELLARPSMKPNRNTVIANRSSTCPSKQEYMKTWRVERRNAEIDYRKETDAMKIEHR